MVEAARETAAAKRGFTVEDVYARAQRVLEGAILHGTTRLRTFVEIDPRAGFRSFEAILRADPGLDLKQGPAARPPAQLPLDVAGFTGRDDQLARLDTFLAKADFQPTAVLMPE